MNPPRRQGFAVLLISLLSLGSAWGQAPQPADVAAPKLAPDGSMDAKFASRHAAFLERDKQGNIGLVFLGDSITEGWFWDHNPDIWNAHLRSINPWISASAGIRPSTCFGESITANWTGSVRKSWSY